MKVLCADNTQRPEQRQEAGYINLTRKNNLEEARAACPHQSQQRLQQDGRWGGRLRCWIAEVRTLESGRSQHRVKALRERQMR